MGWPHRERELMLALERVHANTGPNGEWMPDATSERADPNYYGEDAIRPRVSMHTNWWEKQRLDEQEAWKKSAGENANLNGMYWTVESAESRPDNPRDSRDNPDPSDDRSE